ncbi:hypothetical protein [Altererythrobacter sp. MF3-039]|uniref:hypothetical protein n=1 Tax=Altererythrobacter sp. MF3-039 TaxID=3252901 RepID=UPI00390C761C
MQRKLFTTASFALILSTLPAPAMAEEDQPEAPTIYGCANGMILGVSYLTVRGHGVIEIEFPTGRDLGIKTKRLLPETQTGSGVRYASDITEFHVKGDTARFSTAVSAKSEAIPSVECTRVLSEEERGPVTQEARAGRYFIDSGHALAYAQAEAICFGPDASGYFGINRASGIDRVITYNGRGAKQARVGPVDAGASQRRYTLTSLKNPQEQVTLQFIAQGSREMDQPSATAGFSSISQKGDKVDCVDNDRIVYVGISPPLGLAITAGDDGLALRSFGDDKDPAWQDMRQGYVSIDEDETVFHFFERDTYIRVETNHDGMPGLDENDMQVPRRWSLDSPIAQRVDVPVAYFLADRSVLKGRAPSLSATTSRLLKSLSICNHLAGEVSDDRERNAQLSQSIEKAKCDAVPRLYSEALEGVAEGSTLHEYLKGNAPNWI